MKEGAFGLSAGLVYVHTRLAKFQDLIDMGVIVNKNMMVFLFYILEMKEKN